MQTSATSSSHGQQVAPLYYYSGVPAVNGAGAVACIAYPRGGLRLWIGGWSIFSYTLLKSLKRLLNEGGRRIIKGPG